MRAFGRTLDGQRLVEDEAGAIREAAARVLAGDALSAIVREWNQRGLTTTTGGPWRVGALSRLLVQRRLCDDPPILSNGDRDRLVALHASRRKGPRRATRRYLLTGLLRCWRCGATLTGTTRAPGPDYYICPGAAHGGCSGTAVVADRAEAAVTEMVLDHLESANVVFREVDAGPAEKKLHDDRRRLLELGRLWVAGDLDSQEWASLRSAVRRRVRAAETEVRALGRLAAVHRMAAPGANLRPRWPSMTIDERREVIHAVLSQVVVLPAEPPKQVFRAGRLRPYWLNSGSDQNQPGGPARQ